LANQAFGQEGTKGQTRQQLYDQFRSIAVRGGAGGEGAQNVVRGMRSFQRLTGAPEIMFAQTAGGGTFAERMVQTATATDADVGDVGAVLGERVRRARLSSVSLQHRSASLAPRPIASRR
jgi:hypothetical protein